MEIKDTIRSQYYASFAMLQQAIEACPKPLWEGPEHKTPFWQIAYHALYYAHLYLQPTEEDFVPWEKNREEYRALGSWGEGSGDGEALTQAEVLAFHALCCEQAEKQVEAMDLEAASGFHWLPFDKLELQFYNIRHIQQHTGELYERLGAHADIELGWVGRKPD